MSADLYRDNVGVVLRTYKLGEADRIIVLLTVENGKVRAVAQGVRKTSSKFAPGSSRSATCGCCCTGAAARHRQPGRVGRAARAAAVEPRPGIAGHGRARGGRPAVDGARAGTEPVPDAGRGAAHDRRSSGPAVVRRSTGSCSPPRDCARHSTAACGVVRPNRTSPSWRSTSRRAACCAAACWSGQAISPAALTLLRGILGGGLNAVLSVPASPATHSKSASSPPAWNTTSNDASAPSPCSSSTEQDRF